MKIVTIHPFDPWGNKIGGIENVIRAFLRDTPPELEHYLIGVSQSSRDRPTKQWQTIEFEHKPIHFFPLFYVPKPNQRSWFPLFLRFSLALYGNNFYDLDDMLGFYHRIDPLAIGPKICRQNALYIHSHPLEWIGRRSEVKWKYLPWLYHIIENRAVSRSQTILTVTQHSRDYLQSKYPHQSSHFHFAPTGFRESCFHSRPQNEASKLRQTLSATYNISSTNQWIIFAARLEEQKNPQLALESFAELHKHYPQADLLIAGTGKLLNGLQKLADSMGITERTHFLGPLQPEELSELYAAADAFLMTSRFEGMPVGALEALACGLPIVATAVGELPSIIQAGINGYLVQQHSAQEISQHLVKILSAKTAIAPQTCANSVQDYKSQNAIAFITSLLRENKPKNNSKISGTLNPTNV